MDKKIGILITVFVALIVGFVLLTTLADQGSTLDDDFYTGNESVTQFNTSVGVANYVDLDNNFIATFHELRDFSGIVVAEDNYTVNLKEGRIEILYNATDQVAGVRTFYTNYTYWVSAIGMPENSASRTLSVDIVQLMFIIGLLAVSVVLVWHNRDLFGID